MTLTGRTAGLLMTGASILAGVVAVAWLLSGLSDAPSGLRLSGALFGGAMIFIAVVLPLVAGGIFLSIRGAAETRQYVNAERQRKMLGIVESAGQISTITPTDEVQNRINECTSDALGASHRTVSWWEWRATTPCQRETSVSSSSPPA